MVCRRNVEYDNVTSKNRAKVLETPCLKENNQWLISDVASGNRYRGPIVRPGQPSMKPIDKL